MEKWRKEIRIKESEIKNIISELKDKMENLKVWVKEEMERKGGKSELFRMGIGGN